MANENIRVLVLQEDYNKAMNSGKNDTWISLATNGVKIVDVTPAIKEESRIKISRDSEFNGTDEEDWHTLPKEPLTQYKNIDDEPQRKVLLESTANKRIPINATCYGCQHLYTREKKLRTRLKMAEAFIHTINHRLEIDTVLISEKINERVRVMEQLERNNLCLHQQKHEAHSKLMQVEKDLHETRIEEKRLQSENKTLKEQLHSLQVLFDINNGYLTKDNFQTKPAIKNALKEDAFQTKKQLFREDNYETNNIAQKAKDVEPSSSKVKHNSFMKRPENTVFTPDCYSARTQTDINERVGKPVGTSTPVKEKFDFAMTNSFPNEDGRSTNKNNVSTIPERYLVRATTPATTYSEINSNSTDQKDMNNEVDVDDDCYIMKLKDQASAVRHQLINIQGLLSNMNDISKI